MRLLWCFLILVPLSRETSALRALGIYPNGVWSHNIMFQAMFEALAERGHSVVMMSPFVRKTPIANYTDVDISSITPKSVNRYPFETMVAGWWPGYDLFKIIKTHLTAAKCRLFFSSQTFRDLMDGKYGKFDVIFTEALGTHCFSVIAYKMKVPRVGMLSLPDTPWVHDQVGSINNPSYVPNVYEDLPLKMNFFQRAFNAFSCLFFNFLHKRFLLDDVDEVTREFLGEDMPPVAEVIRNTSLLIVNRHLSVEPSVPTPPNVVHVGGLHVKSLWKNWKPRLDELSPELRAWMDGADDHGVVVFAFGSMVPLSSFPVASQINVLENLGRLPHRVVLKFENDELPAKLSANIRVEKWLPQAHVLAHPKVVLFVSHCGLMGTQESVAAGVPILCVPIFADQMSNAELYIARGIGERVNPKQLATVNLAERIIKMAQGGGYLARAREMAARNRDRPRSVEEEAVWWVEYVVRHRGAPHLRPLGADLPLHQYLLLDVAAAGLLLLLLLLLPAALLLRRLAAACRRPAATATSPAKKRR